MKNRRLLAFYGDDFTGSTDAMEALDSFGLRTILFLEPPTDELLERFSDAQCIGVAGTARAKSNEEMEKELAPVYQKFQEMNPYFVHYKVCSTFDSAPEVGSIGYAADLARRYFENATYPLLVAAPALGRYTVFGNHFANFHGSIYRLDQHPVMSKHPVTPMDEANLATHLQKQTDQSIGTVDIVEMDKEPEKSNHDENIVLYDAAEEKHMRWFADKVWQDRGEQAQFLIGSSGIEYALGEKWDKDGVVERKAKERKPRDIEQMLVVSGSVSEVTKRQLEHAENAGFHMEQLPYELFTEESIPEDYLNRIIELLDSEKKVILYTAKGTEDAAIKATREHLTQAGIPESEIGIHIGRQLGRWTKYIMEHAALKRVVISGGDTSGFVTSQLGIYGLEVLQGIAPGAPLCRAYSDDERFDDLEIALKSGQLGGEGFFENVFLAKKTY
ncbi:four-carbon acid sugar kinase family protein [Oceanobacillus kapialis]|uniref:four-carbon acid sugar kinase family protein n=1 Tax=Oceanobacillus kapialis TaxID=481353 RepID=UPI003850EF2A